MARIPNIRTTSIAPQIAVLLTAALSSAAVAQFAPGKAIVDPSNPSSATITGMDPNQISRVVDHYYYDCLKKKWVWVSREWSHKNPRAFSSDEWLPGPSDSNAPAAPSTKELPPGPPPGAEISAGDPSHAYNPTTGQNLVKENDGSWIDVKTGKVVLAPKLCPCPEPQTTPQPPPPPPKTPKTPKGAENTVCPEKKRTAMVQPPDKTATALLASHNAERAAVGAPPLQWNPTLASDATDWAQQLARIGQLVHAPREGRGIERENLSQGLPWWTPTQMIQNWVNEKSDFTPGLFPNVARDGNWLNVAHYTQMIWPTTTDLGCGMASGHGFQWLVCRYSPGGNKDGKPVIAPPGQLAQAPCIEQSGLRPERG